MQCVVGVKRMSYLALHEKEIVSMRKTSSRWYLVGNHRNRIGIIPVEDVCNHCCCGTCSSCRTIDLSSSSSAHHYGRVCPLLALSQPRHSWPFATGHERQVPISVLPAIPEHLTVGVLGFTRKRVQLPPRPRLCPTQDNGHRAVKQVQPSSCSACIVPYP